IAGIMLDQKSDKTFVRAEWRAMDADRNLVDVIAVLVAKIETTGLRKIDLVGRDGKLASDYAPRLHVDLRPVKRRFVRHFDIIDSGVFQNVARHLFGFFPEFRFSDKFLAEPGWIASREPHHVFVPPKKV